MKKAIVFILSLCLLLTALAACGKTPAEPGATEPIEPAQLKVVCTIFPVYDWTRQILGDRLADTELTLLLDSGMDLHSYEPLPEDLLALADCDLFVYVGGESDDKWAPGTIETLGLEHTLNLLEALGDAAKEEEDVAGMQEAEEEEEEGALDEHVWLSLKNAAALCGRICEQLCAVDPENAETYKANTEAYVKERGALDARYADTVEKAAFKSILVADRYPFRYLCEDYGITPYAAFSGCSTESQASMGTIAGLAGYLDELGLHAVVVTESSDGATAEAVIGSSSNRDCAIVVMDSLQSVTKEKVEAGASYLNVMETNLKALETALN